MIFGTPKTSILAVNLLHLQWLLDTIYKHHSVSVKGNINWGPKAIEAVYQKHETARLNSSSEFAGGGEKFCVGITVSEAFAKYFSSVYGDRVLLKVSRCPIYLLSGIKV